MARFSVPQVYAPCRNKAGEAVTIPAWQPKYAASLDIRTFNVILSLKIDAPVVIIETNEPDDVAFLRRQADVTEVE